MLRSLIAILLATDVDARTIRTLSAAGAPAGDALVACTSLDRDAKLYDISRRWTSEHLSLTGPASSPSALTDLHEAQRLPLLIAGGSVPDVATLSPRCPIAIHIEKVRRPRLSLCSPNSAWHATLLDSFARQVGALADCFCSSPHAPLGELIEQLPSLRFVLTLAGNSGHENLAPVISFWAEEIGLPVALKTVQLGQLDVPAPRDLPAPRDAGATVILTRPDEWTRSRRSKPLRLVQPPPPEARLGQLSGGVTIVEHDAGETRQLDEEIFIDRIYMRHGIEIPDHATVVDAGANIGLFALFAHCQADGVRVHLVEPVSELAKLAQVNTAMYGVCAAVHTVALGAYDGQGDLTFYPKSSLQSSLYADLERDMEIAQRYVKNQIEAAGNGRLVHDRELQTLLANRASSVQRLVSVNTLSTLIEENRIHQIDLLKMDVERGEADVLRGITPGHWDRIRQLVVEVHDPPDIAEHLVYTLEQRGFSVTAERRPRFIGTEISMLYATRHHKKRPAKIPEGCRAIAAAAIQWRRHSTLPIHIAVLSRPFDKSSFVSADLLAAEVRDIPDVNVISVDLPSSKSAQVDLDATEVGTAILRHVTAPMRPLIKAIVVDADDVLWRGICGEVGPERVRVEASHIELQQTLLELRATGHFICLCSRNNEADVTAAFAVHSWMPLRLEHFSAKWIGWGQKSDAIAAMTDELHISPDSVAFLDDDPAVRSEVALRLPQVTVIELPSDPARHVEALRNTWALHQKHSTREDLLRSLFSESQHARNELAAKAPTFREFLEQLDLTVDISAVGTADVERVGQLARRTNQFNFTLRRHSLVEVRELLACSTLAIIARASDRFGEYGIVGFAAGRAANDAIDMTDWFLSCRALGKNIEWAMLQAIGKRALAEGMASVRLSGVNGDRNAPVHSFMELIARRCRECRDCADGVLQVSAAELASLEWRCIEDAPLDAPTVKTRPSNESTVAYRWPAPGLVSMEELAERLHHIPRRERKLLTSPAPTRNELEQRIACVWQNVLGIDRVGIHDDLFALGGDSLAAVAICSQLRQQGDIVPLEAVLDCPTIAATARYVSQMHRVQSCEVGISKMDTAGPRIATDGQRRVWAAEQTGADGSQIIPLAYNIEGQINVTRLELAIAQTIKRHMSLHSALVVRQNELFTIASDPDFVLYRQIMEKSKESSATAWVRAHGERFLRARFDLAAGVMLRGMLLTISPIEHVLLLALHHSAADGWSIGLIQRDISACYANAADEPPPAGDLTPYADATRRRESTGEWQQALRFYSRTLGEDELCSLRLRSDMPREPHRPRSAHLSVWLPDLLAAEIKALAHERGTTVFAIHLAALQLVLGVHDNRRVVSIGCPFANRDEPELEEVVGFLANIVPIALSLEWSGTLLDHLEASCKRTRDSLRNAALPYGLLLRERHGDPYRFDPPFAAMLTLQQGAHHLLALAGATVSPIDPPHSPLPFEFMVDIEDRSDGTRAVLRYDGALFSRATVRGIIDAHLAALTALTGIQRLPLTVMRELLTTVLHESANPLPAVADARRGRIDRLRAGGTG